MTSDHNTKSLQQFNDFMSAIKSQSGDEQWPKAQVLTIDFYLRPGSNAPMTPTHATVTTHPQHRNIRTVIPAGNTAAIRMVNGLQVVTIAVRTTGGNCKV
jgi:hypothetical protein